jgi:hypothetical protein
MELLGGRIVLTPADGEANCFVPDGRSLDLVLRLDAEVVGGIQVDIGMGFPRQQRQQAETDCYDKECMFQVFL